MIMRKSLSVFFLFHCFFGLVAQTTSADSNSPNIIVFMVDDLKPNLGIYNDSYSKSPHIDQLGREGMRFVSPHATILCLVKDLLPLVYIVLGSILEMYIQKWRPYLNCLKTTAIMRNQLERFIMWDMEIPMMKIHGVFPIMVKR